MARGSATASTAATTAQNTSNNLFGGAGSLYASLAPQLEAQAAHPAGFSPTAIADMDTAGQQEAGGATAGAVGQGGLLAARTRNAGAPMAAIAESTREATRAGQQGVLSRRIANEQLKSNQRSQALSEMGGLYGTETGAGVGEQGQVAPNVNANTQAENASWNWASQLLNPALQAAGRSKYF